MDCPLETKHGHAVLPGPARVHGQHGFREEMWTLSIQWDKDHSSPPVVFIGSHGQADEYKRQWYRYMRDLGLKVGTGGLTITIRRAVTPGDWAAWLTSRAVESE